MPPPPTTMDKHRRQKGSEGDPRRMFFTMIPGAAVVIIISLTFTACQAAPAPGAKRTQSLKDQQAAEEYLSRFYPKAGKGKKIPGNDFATKLKSMQQFFGLEVTGKLDSNTLEVMGKPRCGIPDVSHYTLLDGKPKWEKNLVTYRITKYTPDLSQKEVDCIISQAFKLYSDIIPLDFKQIFRGTADIMIQFSSKDHDDFYPFDGPLGTLAHAFSPGEDTGGDTHFDEDEEWTLSQTGINLFLVAAHEFGHALGLDHSKDKSALMFPTYQYVDTKDYQLPSDDRAGIQALYGVRKPPGKPNPKPEPKPKPKPEPERCRRDLVFDAATSIRNELYFFKGGYYWKKTSLSSSIPIALIRNTWPSISSVDAAYENTDKDVAYLFKGEQYWAVKGTQMQPGYPKAISRLGFPSQVTAIDSAVYVAATKKTLFFVNDKYWSYDERRGKMDHGYPRPISQNFQGIGTKVDAAFQNYGYFYFSEGARQIEYRLESKTTNRVLLNYGWLDCY
uniref:Matrix metallopeptidase 30 n=1 Tax=Paramormyrops kingsleyae TaxID=1676925 RepID=A0A3B3RXF3_9TELE|nr:collagenase 3-like [Paramormyrops kingsleyae]